MASNLIENRQIRIFISSTFTDMEAERNLLIKYVFPQLRVEASKRNVSLMTVDLRWGITEEEYKRGKILEICLSEIENSHPFFIGILGDRYGWQPDISQIQKNVNLKERYPWITDDLAAGLSVTEIEMQFGVLRKQAETNASFFIKQASDSHDYAESADAQQKLQRLKQEVMSNGRYPYYLYSDVEEIGQQVKIDFMALLDKYFPEKEQSAIETERNAQRSVLNALCASYIPVEENFAALHQFLDSEQKQFCITGASGLGKSALMANWIKQLEEKNEYTVIYHFVGTSDTGTYYENILKRFSDEICDRFSIDISDEDYKKKPEDLLNHVIFGIPSNQKVILIIDAVNQINENNYAKQLAWLPALPSHVKLVLSTLPDDDTFAAVNRREFAVHTLKPLERQDRVRMVTEYLKCYGKTLTRKQLLRIITNKVTENTLVLKTLLNQLILFGKYEELDQRIDYYLEAQSISEFFQKVLQRSEEDYGKELTRHALSLIGLSRNGMSESALTDIMRCTPLEWSQVYCAFVSHFNIKNGLINFAHTYLKDAVSDRYLRDLEANKKLRVEITTYFEGSEEPLSLDELPYQYYLMEDNEKLYGFVINILIFRYLYHKDELELYKYWQRLREDQRYTHAVGEYFKQIEHSEFNDEEKSTIYKELGCFFNEYIDDIDLAYKCGKKSLKIARKIYGATNPNLALNYDNIGFIYNSMGHYNQALICHKKALKILLHIGAPNLYDVAQNYSNIASAYLSMERYDEALVYLRKELELNLQLSGEQSPDIATTFCNIGVAYSSLNEIDKSLEYFNKSLEIFLLLYGENSLNSSALYRNIGMCYQIMEQYENALTYYLKALDIQLNLLGEKHIETSHTYMYIASLYRSIENYNEALSYLNKALNIQLHLEGGRNPLTAELYDNIGGIYYLLECYDQALKYHRLGLKIMLSKHLEVNPRTASIYVNMGVIYDLLEDYNRAQKYFKNALKIRLQLNGETSYETAICYKELGSTYVNLGEYTQALQCKEKVLNIYLKIYGEMHLETAACYADIGYMYLSLGQFEKAIEGYEKSLKIHLELLGEMHLDVAACFETIGVIYDSMGLYSKALPNYEKSVHIKLTLLKEKDVSYLSSYEGLSRCYYMLGYYYEAELKFQHLMELQGENIDPINIYQLADTKRQLGKYNESINLLAILEEKGKKGESSATVHSIWGINLFYLERYEEALAMHLKAWKEKKGLYGEDSNQAMNAYDWVGRDYLMLNELDKAISILTTVCQFYKDSDPDSALFSYKYLAIAYGKSGEKEKAISMLEEGLQQLDRCDASKYANKGNFLYDYASYLYEEGELVKALKLAEEGLHFMQLYYGDFNHPHKTRLDKLIEDIKHQIL